MTTQNHEEFGNGACEDVLAVSAESDRPCADSLEEPPTGEPEPMAMLDAGGQTAPIALYEGDSIKN